MLALLGKSPGLSSELAAVQLSFAGDRVSELQYSLIKVAIDSALQETWPTTDALRTELVDGRHAQPTLNKCKSRPISTKLKQHIPLPPPHPTPPHPTPARFEWASFCKWVSSCRWARSWKNLPIQTCRGGVGWVRWGGVGWTNTHKHLKRNA